MPNQCPEWFSKPTTLKNRFVFPIHALITYLPNRQINELKATLFEQGNGMREGREGKQLAECAESGSKVQTDCDK